MSIPRARPFWERERDGGPITDILASRKRLEEKFYRKRARLRRPDLYIDGSEEPLVIAVKDAGLAIKRARES